MTPVGNLDRLAKPRGFGTHQIAMAWLLSRPAVASVIVGAESAEQLSADASAAGVELSADQLDAISNLALPS